DPLPIPPSSRTTIVIPLVGKFRRNNGDNVPRSQEKETPHLHPKP
ncbi:hypothetical protein A2U01_0095057, partial [Trifolium medium]|nr:hypothetical protein [Trifolium medium]